MLLSQDKRNISDDDLLKILTNRRIPDIKFLPYSEHTKKNKVERRYLGARYFEQFPWLTTSNVKGYEGAWCLWCSLMKVSDTCGGWYTGGQQVGVLVSKPLTKFAKLTGKDGSLTNHNDTQYHKAVASKVDEFMSRAASSSRNDIRCLIDDGRQLQIQENRRKLKPIIDTILTCAKQNISLRGHRDSGRLSTEDPDNNDGNFRALLRMRIRAGDTDLQGHVETSAANSQYTSPQIQNELIDITSKLITESLVKDVKKAKIWSLLADETQDRNKRELLVLVVRYIGEKDGVPAVMESPIMLIDLLHEITLMLSKKQDDEEIPESEILDDECRMSGENIGKVLLAKVESLGLDLNFLVGQGYDGAANMSSEQVGAAAEVHKHADLAHYFHCAMHMLNLCASETTRVPEIRNCLDVIRELTQLFSGSAKRTLLLETEIRNSENVDDAIRRARLVKLCTTRFVERHEAVITVVSLLPFVVGALEKMTQWHSRDARMKANTMLRSIESFDFLFALHALSAVSGLLQPAARGIQKVSH